MINLHPRENCHLLKNSLNSIIYEKYSRKPRLNYDFRQFSEFVKPISKDQISLIPQIQCQEFLYTFPHQQYLNQYYSFEDIFNTIKNTILERVEKDHCCPMNCQDQTIYFQFQKFKSDIKKLKQQGWSKQDSSDQVRLSLEKQSMINFSKIQQFSFQDLENSKEQSKQHSTNVLNRITKDLSEMIYNLNESRLQISLTEYLKSLKRYKTQKKRDLAFKKQLKEQNISDIEKNMHKNERFFKLQKLVHKKDIETETYGLCRIKRRQSHEKKRKENILNCNTQLWREKNKASPETPKVQSTNQWGQYPDSKQGNNEKTEKKMIFHNKKIKSQGKVSQLSEKIKASFHSRSKGRKGKGKVKGNSKGIKKK